jgi:hypothetical protein
MEMKRCTYRVNLALTVLAVLGPTVAVAQQSTNLVPFKATMAGEFRGLLIPLNPPIVSEQLTSTGQADLLGQVTSTDHYLAHLGVDGKLASITDGIAVLTAPNGDALFITYSGLPHPPAAGQFAQQELAFTVTGGQGRFTGATGGGVIRDAIFMMQGTPPTFTITRTFEGVVTAPKP